MSQGGYIPGRVHVPVVHAAASRAGPLADVSGFGPSFTPHVEHTWDVGSNRPIFPKMRPCLRALYSSIR